MPNVQQGFTPKDLDQTFSQNVRISNINASTSETSHTLITNLRQLIIRARENTAKLQLAYTVGESTTNYITVEPHCVLELKELKFSGVTLYITANKTTVVEIHELY